MDRILPPGEREIPTEAKRRESGIFVEDRTWQQIEEIARTFRVDGPATW
jgi:LDH2 family malate/lactate/ureidoglycolate dehydrogenase